MSAVMERFSHNTKTWEPPLELQRSTPREVTLTAQGKALVVAILLFATAAIAGGVALAGKASADEHRWAAWKAEAVLVQGQVTGLRKQGSGDNSKYFVDYSYAVNGEVYAASESVRPGEWRRRKPGEPIEVAYRRSEPAQSWLPGHEPTGVPRYAAFLLGGGMLIPALILAHTIRRQRWLLEEGRAARAKVVGKKNISHEHGRHYRIDYEFQTLEGAKRSGRFNVNKKPPEIGEELIVVYDRDEEKRSARYPLSLVKVVTNG
jgi:hypothetical protein